MFATAGLIDVETTGFSPIYDEIIEFAICLFKFNEETGEIVGVTDHYVGLREPKKRIPGASTRVHGITDSDVRGQVLDRDKIESLLHRADFLVAHNASFDRKFTEGMFPCAEEKHWLCSMRGISWRKKGFSSMGLQNLLQAHGITVNRAHRAHDDVLATIRLISQTCVDGKPYFAELLERLPKQARVASITESAG